MQFIQIENEFCFLLNSVAILLIDTQTDLFISKIKKNSLYYFISLFKNDTFCKTYKIIIKFTLFYIVNILL